MGYSSQDFVKLVLWRASDGRTRWVRTLRSTADNYGWTQEFELWTPKALATSGRYQLAHRPDRSGAGIPAGGKRRRICRSESRRGNPKGMTNQFTMSNSCRLIDYAELAHFTQGEWHWMEGPSCERISRDGWEAIYETAGQNRGAGLVSV